jgi:trimethylamine:corrinoid methyltransferase-like protein
LTTLPLSLAGADVIQGIGLLESSMTLSLEQILIDAEIAGFVPADAGWN